MVNVRKRGNVYEYNFDVAKIEGKRKRITKSGFKTKAEALKQGTIAYNEYLNTGRKFVSNEVSYSDFLDCWLDNYGKLVTLLYIFWFYDITMLYYFIEFIGGTKDGR